MTESDERPIAARKVMDQPLTVGVFALILGLAGGGLGGTTLGGSGSVHAIETAEARITGQIVALSSKVEAYGDRLSALEAHFREHERLAAHARAGADTEALERRVTELERRNK